MQIGNCGYRITSTATQRGPADMQNIGENALDVKDLPRWRASLAGRATGPYEVPNDFPLMEASGTTSNEKLTLQSLVASEEAEQTKLPPGEEGKEAAPQNGLDKAEGPFQPNPLVVGRLSNSSHDKPFACPHCSFSTSSQLAINRHKKRVHGGGYSLKRLQCSLCEYQTISSVAFAQHLRATHRDAAGNKQLVCPCCDYQSDVTAAMLEHLSLHDNLQEKRHACPRCDFRSSNKNELNEHVREKHIQNLTCPHCTYQTCSQQKLARHIEIHDENEKKYICPHCDYKTNRKDCFCTHVFSHESSWAKFN